jgi:hypothetical protein
MPAVFRVIWTPRSRAIPFKEIHTTQVVGPRVALDAGTEKLDAKQWEVEYVLVGAIRHRDEHNFDLARFYIDTGLYLIPPMVDGRVVKRPYISDSWRIGEPGATCTLVYVRGCPPYELSKEFLPTSLQYEDEKRINGFEGFNNSRQLPKRRSGVLDISPHSHCTSDIMASAAASANSTANLSASSGDGSPGSPRNNSASEKRKADDGIDIGDDGRRGDTRKNKRSRPPDQDANQRHNVDEDNDNQGSVNQPPSPSPPNRTIATPPGTDPNGINYSSPGRPIENIWDNNGGSTVGTASGQGMEIRAHPRVVMSALEQIIANDNPNTRRWVITRGLPLHKSYLHMGREVARSLKPFSHRPMKFHW